MPFLSTKNCISQKATPTNPSVNCAQQRSKFSTRDEMFTLVKFHFTKVPRMPFSMLFFKKSNSGSANSPLTFTLLKRGKVAPREWAKAASNQQSTINNQQCFRQTATYP